MYKDVAESDDRAAQYQLALCYKYGFGCAKDNEEAAKWMRKAVANSERSYEENFWSTMDDDLMALANYEMAMIYKGNKSYEQMNEDNFKKMLDCMVYAARHGHAESQYIMGGLWAFLGKNAKESVEWYQMAADQGHPLGLFNLGVCYENGYGVIRNREKAIEYYKQAADQGEQKAINALRRMKVMK